MTSFPPVLTVRTRALEGGEPLHDLLPDTNPLSWVCRGEGLVGWGQAARFEPHGGQRFSAADQWWQRQCERMDIRDEVRLPGTGPVAFASMAFADQPGDSTVVVPEVVIGQRAGVRWLTTIGDAQPPSTGSPSTWPVHGPGTVRYSDGQLSTTGYREAVAAAVDRLRQQRDIAKIVLAHDLLATTSDALDVRFLLHNLAKRYPDCWTFVVDGLVGATPELLLERTGEHIRSRVLAGTVWPRDGLDTDQLSKELVTSPKNHLEHAYAVESLTTRLKQFCARLTVPETPAILRLRNVLHLASDISGTLRPPGSLGQQASLLRMAEAIHPTAAVGGTPTSEAVKMIHELEGMDRQRYAGPVGWIDADGNGEFGLALRCAQIQQAQIEQAQIRQTQFKQSQIRRTETRQAQAGQAPPASSQVRLFAGGGIVADSDPDLEVAEAEAKLLPIREALEGVE